MRRSLSLLIAVFAATLLTASRPIHAEIKSATHQSKIPSIAQKSFDSAALAAMFDDYATSSRDFRTAIAAAPQFAQAHYGLAAVLAKHGERSEAMKSLERAVTLDRSLRKLALIDIDFAQLRGTAPFLTLTMR